LYEIFYKSSSNYKTLYLIQGFEFENNCLKASILRLSVEVILNISLIYYLIADVSGHSLNK